MKKSELSNINISDEQVLITPQELKNKIPLGDNARQFIQQSRQTISNIIHKALYYKRLKEVIAFLFSKPRLRLVIRRRPA